MRLKLGRPDLAAYSTHFDVPPASPTTPLSVAWGGVTTLLVDDGELGGDDRRILLPPKPSQRRRPPIGAVAAADRCRTVPAVGERVSKRWSRCTPISTTRWTPPWSPTAPARGWSAATSAAHIGRGHGLDRIDIVESRPAASPPGDFDITLIEGHHCPPDRFPGAITAPVVPPVKASAYRCGEAWSMLVHHRPSGQSLLIVGSAGFVRGRADRPARRRRLPRASANWGCSRRATSPSTGRRPCGWSAHAEWC